MQIPFNDTERKKLYTLLDEVFDSNFWSHGNKNKDLENKFTQMLHLNSATVSCGGAGLRALYDYAGIKDKDVLSPVNTFWATHLAIQQAGGNPVFVDCNKEDLCLSLEDLKKRLTPNTGAVTVTHIGGHIAFDIDGIVDFCRSRGLPLIEDCAHAHGATYNGKSAGSFGLGGAYSFYSTKTLPMGEGGLVVSTDTQLINWVQKYRDYGKEIINGKVTYPIKNGFNFRMSELTAALGLVQVERLAKIIKWKRNIAKKYDEIFQNSVRLPKNMESGFYKYIVFEETLKNETGKVFNLSDSGPAILGKKLNHPNFEWVAKNHSCAPIYYGFCDDNIDIKDLKSMLL